MMEPARLIDECPGELEAALLRAGRDVGASNRARARTLAALGIAGSALVASKSAAASATGWSVSQVVVGGALAVAATVGVVALTVGSPSPAVDSVLTTPPIPIAPPTLSAPSAEISKGILTPTAPSEVPKRAIRKPRPTPAPRTAPSASIADELKSLDAARSALSAGNPAGALTRLDEHARRYPRGGLALEAEVLRIEALAQSGNRAAAATRARAFVARYPTSVFTPRVRRIAGE
ncbi:MAG: hypothetical protein JW751_09535 [Polyangiaceae bacterium]|nr:hypothetical protein [Polyangiaceae bacterium]